MIQTYVIYLGVPLVCGLLARQAVKQDRKRYVWLIIAVLTLVSGLRSFQTGLDTYNYLAKIALIAAGEPEYAYGFEDSFKVICFLLSRLSQNGTFFLCVFAFITNALVILRLWDFRGISSFAWMVLCYYSCFYFMTMNGIRQFCAVAIVFYATRYLNQKRLLAFLIGVLIAVLFHRSALVGLVFITEELRQWKRLNRRERVVLIGCLGALPAAILAALSVGTDYIRYFANISLDVGFMIPVKLLFYLVTLIFVYPIYKRMLMQAEPGAPEMIPGICAAYILGLLLTALGYMYAQVERIGWYFYLYEGAYLGILQKDRSPLNRYVFGGVAVLLIGYSFFYSIHHNSQGNVPYLFFWQG